MFLFHIKHYWVTDAVHVELTIIRPQLLSKTYIPQKKRSTWGKGVLKVTKAMKKTVC
jgi:hypothetical protein